MKRIAREMKKLAVAKEAMVFAWLDGRFQSVPTRLTKLNRRGELVLIKKERVR